SDTLSFRSIRKTRITSWASPPSAAQTSPISLAKEILSAWKALETYFAISAERTDVVTKGASTEAYSARRADTAASSAAPTSVIGGWAKSRSEEPSRMNSGL